MVEIKYKRHSRIQLTTTVLAACNKVEFLPPELLSMFLRLRFRDYTIDEFLEVVKVVLTERENIPFPTATYIDEKVLTELLSRDPRNAIKIARLLEYFHTMVQR